MRKVLVVRAILDGLRQDARWLGGGGSSGPVRRTGSGPTESPGRRHVVPFALILVVFADVLFWKHGLGLSLAVFSLAVFGIAVFLISPRSVSGPLSLVTLGALPVVDYVQAVSVLFLVAGLVAGLAWLQTERPADMSRVALRSVRLVVSFPFRALQSIRDEWRDRLTMVPGSGFDRGRLSGLIRIWGFPLGGTAVLLALLSGANPIIADWIAQALHIQVDWLNAIERGLFWFGTAMIVWPCLAGPVPGLMAPRIDIGRPSAARVGLNTGSVLRALVLFNLVLGVQTAMDAALLWGGGSLPAGMSFAEYAHRGAYPLLVTALLAGAFALAARRFLDESRWLKPLVLAWLAQNIALCVSSALRLDLYIDSYGLTYLRVYVMIWISVVAVGLALTAWQIGRSRPNRWLLWRCTLLGLGVLYLSSFVNFAQVIADHNLRATQRIDWSYLCNLPDTADAALRAATKRNHAITPPCARFFTPHTGWRDWGFRRWRVGRNMDGMIWSEPAG